jgi:hypothetical protein
MKSYALGDEYYVVRDPATRKCRVVDQKPAVVADMVGRGPLKTWTEAKKGMKTSKVCALVIAPFVVVYIMYFGGGVMGRGILLWLIACPYR